MLKKYLLTLDFFYILVGIHYLNKIRYQKKILI